MGLFKTNREGYKLTYSTEKRLNDIVRELNKAYKPKRPRIKIELKEC